MLCSCFRQQVWINLLICLALIASLGGLTPARAGVSGPAYIITVNDTGDGNIKNSTITLREALLLARGGTTATGTNHSLNDAEKNQITGCTFTGSSNNWSTNVGCGAGYEDTIQFTGMGVGSFIHLALPLTPVSDSGAATNVDGGTVLPFIDATGIGAGDAWTISSNNNTITNIAVYGAPQGSNLTVSGSSNLLDGLISYSANANGIHITGNNNTLNNAKIGVSYLVTCLANHGQGILIDGGASGDTVKNSVIGCNDGNGVQISASASAGNHVIGPNNKIGVDLSGSGDRGNGLSGIWVASNNNQVTGNQIGFNGTDGLDLNGNFNVVISNTVASNTNEGIYLFGTAFFNYLGCTNLCGQVFGNRLTGNGHYGISIYGSSSFNIGVGNQIGFAADGVTADGNLLGGIYIANAHDNIIGGAGAQANYIAGNQGTGVVLNALAYNNKLYGNYIGLSKYNSGLRQMPNLGRGVEVLNGAHDNQIGNQAAAGQGNFIYYNNLEGVLILGSSTVKNQVNANEIYFNHFAGVKIDSTAHDNIIGKDASRQNIISKTASGSGVVLSNGVYSNTVGYNIIGSGVSLATLAPNDQAGVLILGGAHDNHIGGSGAAGQWFNHILYNGRTGVTIQDSATQNNDIIGNVIGGNLWAGVLITATAHDNRLLNNSIGFESGEVSQGNLQYGVYLDGGAYQNIIGDKSGPNKICDNQMMGVNLYGSTTSYNKVNANQICNNDFSGVMLGLGANHNTIGADLSNANTIYGNQNFGVLADAASFNSISYNKIGINGALPAPNAWAGVMMVNSSHDNLVFANTIAYNGRQGVQIMGSATTKNEFTLNTIFNNGRDGILEGSGVSGNWWSHVIMYGNNGLGIDRNGGDDTQNIMNVPYPSITSANTVGGTTTIKGSGLQSVVGTSTVSVEVYSVAINPLGFAEGMAYLGSASTLGNGSWTLVTSTVSPHCYVAFETITIGGVSTSSEFGRSTCGLFMPYLKR